MYRSDGRRRPRRQIPPSHGRSYGSGVVRGKERPTGPSKADVALASVLELFESDELPARVAETYIARLEGTAPCASWSLGNQLLMLLAGTSDARGYRQWQHAGRHVVKGAKAFHILGPVTRKIRERDETTGEETTRPVVAGFVGIPVFRFQDTDGFPVEVPDYTPPELPPLHDVAERLGVDVQYGPHVGQRFRGCYSPNAGRILLLTADEVTFFHELAHAAHDRVLRARGGSLQGGQVPSQEIIAELTAAVLCRLYGLDGHLARSKEYVDHYGGSNPGRAVMRVLNDVQACLLLLLEETLGVTFGAEREAVAA
jgi:hypothetical protein